MVRVWCDIGVYVGLNSCFIIILAQLNICVDIFFWVKQFVDAKERIVLTTISAN